MSLVNYLNASEIIAELRDKKRADNSIIEEQFEPAFRAKVFERLISFKNKNDKNSWKYVRELMDELGK
jgi:hypothetical protein